MISLTKINKKKVKPVVCKNVKDPSKIKGYEYFPSLYANVFIFAKKKSGKSSCVATLLENRVGKNTHVLFFCSTIHKDDVYKEILDKLDKKGISYETHLSLTHNGVDILKRWEEEQEEMRKLEEAKKGKKGEKVRFISFDESEDEKEEEEQNKSKKMYPKYLFVFDDLSNELGSKSLSHLLTRNRHFLSECYISSQYYQHLNKQSRSQMDYLIIYPKIPDDKIDVIHQESDLTLDLPMFHRLYKDATSTPYNFLYVDVRSEMYRRCFSHQYEIKDDYR